MSKYVLSKEAARDFAKIAEYSIEMFGIAQARHYRDSLVRAIEILSENTRMGRDYSHVKENVRRFEHESHVIYYKIRSQDILILRVLHERQDPGLHL